MFKRYLSVGAAASLAVFILGTQAKGSTVSFVESQPSGTTGLSIGTSTDPTAVITALASVPGTLDGYTYTNYALLANEGTGSLEIFGHFPTGTTYVPALGDGITATGKYSPFSAIPELASLTAISQTSTGNPVPAPIAVTIPQLNALGASSTPSNLAIQEYLLTLNNVTINQQNTTNTVPGNFPVHANGTYTLSDGSNSITMFQWASSYSSAGALGGTAIPTGPVDITGIVDVFTSGTTSTPEFIPFSVTSVPEPTSIALLGIGGVALLARHRRAAQL